MKDALKDQMATIRYIERFSGTLELSEKIGIFLISRRLERLISHIHLTTI
jgi:hypothetical protein